MRRTLPALLGFLAIGLAACTHARPATRITLPDGRSRPASKFELQVIREFVRQVEAKTRAESLGACLAAHSPLMELAISGGGSQGAWAAGFLRGWSESGTRPRFGIVTGVSAGAILAVFAFLGPEHDAAMERAYTEVRKRDVMRERPTMFVPFYTAVASSEPLRTRLERLVTPEIISRVADEGDLGRRLYIGTVNLDLGTFRAWDLTAEAGPRTPASYRRCIDVLMASMAVGVLYPPVFIDGAMHGDGGARRHVFAVLPESETPAAEAVSPGSAAPPTTYVLVNVRPAVATRLVPNSIIDIGARNVELLADEALHGSLARIERDARRAGMEFRLATIPAGACMDASAGSMIEFNAATLRCLYDQGVKDGLARAWIERAPD
ncbi:MAG: patatin-like phospholipase family protein [Phycisphaerae bacterium]|nr:patatin-like phospholipase family protein [Phycisphaerae bacterium]